MRGKGGIFAGRVGAEGITPAYAGKSKPFFFIGLHTKDHPRVCGEKSLAIAA